MESSGATAAATGTAGRVRSANESGQRRHVGLGLTPLDGGGQEPPPQLHCLDLLGTPARPQHSPARCAGAAPTVAAGGSPWWQPKHGTEPAGGDGQSRLRLTSVIEWRFSPVTAASERQLRRGLPNGPPLLYPISPIRGRTDNGSGTHIICLGLALIGAAVGMVIGATGNVHRPRCAVSEYPAPAPVARSWLMTAVATRNSKSIWGRCTRLRTIGGYPLRSVTNSYRWLRS